MKRLLILRASQDVEDIEVDHITAVARILEIESCVSDMDNADDLTNCLCGNGNKWDFVYIAGHANSEGFGEKSGMPFIQWFHLATTICLTECLENNAVILLACCHGGMKRIATTLFFNCMQIAYVCGPQMDSYPT